MHPPLILDPEMFEGTYDEWVEHVTGACLRQRAEIARLRAALRGLLKGTAAARALLECDAEDEDSVHRGALKIQQKAEKAARAAVGETPDDVPEETEVARLRNALAAMIAAGEAAQLKGDPITSEDLNAAMAALEPAQ